MQAFWPRDPETLAMRREIGGMVGPCMLELVLVSLLSMADMIMVGSLGANAINAVAITDNPVLISFVIFQAFNVGGTALTARFIGQNDIAGARRATVMVLLCNFFFGIVVSAAEFAFARELVLLMGADDEYLADATIYMRYAAVGVLFTAVPSAVTAQLRSVGNTRISLQYNVVANLFNILCNWLLIFGVWGFPAMGVEGAAIATLGSKIVSCLISLGVLFFNVHLPIRVRPRNFLKLDFPIIWRVARIGLPTMAEQVVMRVGLITFTRMVTSIGNIEYSAHNIVMRIQGLSFNISQSFGIVASALTGRSLGAGAPEKAEKYIKICRRTGLMVSLAMSLFFAFFGRYVGMAFNRAPEILHWVSILMIFLAFTIPGQTSNLILGGSLRGAGDTLWPLVATISGIFGMRVGIAYILINVLGLGLYGAWAAFLLDQSLRALVTLLRFHSGKWKATKV